jgi:hypothetical protein
MSKKNHYDPKKVRGNFGPGSFSDEYDNSKIRSMDRDQHPGGITGIPFEDEYDLDDMKFSPEKGESFLSNHLEHEEPLRDADLGVGRSGTNWNWDLKRRPVNVGRGPKDWKLTDERLKEKVCDVLMHSHDVDPSHFEVIVKDKVVFLKGSIESKGMKRVAEDLVESIPGVEDVFTELKIINDTPHSVDPSKMVFNALKS